MAVLENIRVKMGTFITFLIGIALLSFIIDPDTLQSTVSVFSSKYDVGEIAGKGISYQDYQKKVDYFSNIYQITSGSSSSDDKTQDMINNTAWQDEIAELVLIPTAQKAGITLGEDELLDLSQGKSISPVLENESSFKDASGAFDPAKLVQFVKAIPSDESGNLKIYWRYLEDNIIKDQYYTKYSSLLAKSNIINPIEMKRTLAENNTTYNVDFVVKPFGFETDTTISVSNSEIKSYYEKNKKNFKQQKSLDFEYAVFDVVPSDDDIALTQKDMNKVEAEFATTTNVKNFITRSSDRPYSPIYFKEGELASIAPELEDFAKTGSVNSVLPSFRKDNSYIAARITDIKNMPDSVFVQHILLQAGNEKMADSLMTVIKNGGNFSELAAQYSADKNPNAPTPGELGWMTQQYSIPGFEPIFSANKGDVLKITTNYGLHLVKINNITKPVRKVQMPLLVKEAVAGKVTYSDFYAKANELVNKSEGNIEKFRAALKELNINSYPAQRVAPGAKTFGNYEHTREITRWVNDNKVGAVSPIITVDNNYFFVVAVTGKHEDGLASLSDMTPQIKNLLLSEKKGEKMAADVKNLTAGANSLEAIAEKLNTTVSQQTGVAFSSMNMQQVDPKFIGAISAAKEGELVGPVVGEVGVYYFVIKAKEVGTFYTENDAKQRKAQEFMYISRMLPVVMSEGAKVKDERYKFY